MHPLQSSWCTFLYYLVCSISVMWYSRLGRTNILCCRDGRRQSHSRLMSRCATVQPQRKERGFQRPQNCQSKNKRCFSHSPDQVHGGMDRWIQQFVVPHKICPYAKGSSYSIHVWPHQEMDHEEGNILDFCQKHLPTTIPTNLHRPNIFLSFPNVVEFQEDYLAFFGFYQALMQVLPHAGGDEAACSSSSSQNVLVWQSFVFHPNYVDMTTDEPNLRFQAPFPSLHCIALSDLEKERAKPGRAKSINLRNITTLQCPETQAVLRDIHRDAQRKDT